MERLLKLFTGLGKFTHVMVMLGQIRMQSGQEANVLGTWGLTCKHPRAFTLQLPGLLRTMYSRVYSALQTKNTWVQRIKSLSGQARGLDQHLLALFQLSRLQVSPSKDIGNSAG